MDPQDQAQPQSQDPVTANPPVEQAPAPVVDGPWAKELQAAFGDNPEALTKAHDLLRSTVQPYVTQMETKVKDLTPAGDFLAAFQEDPSTAYLNLTQELFGDDKYAAVQQALLAGESQQYQPEQLYEETEIELPPEVQELVSERQAAKEQAQYEAEIERLREDRQDEHISPEVLAPFVVANEGDVDAAYDAFQSYRDALLAGHQPQAPAEQAPPVVGDSAPSTPPVQEHHSTIDSALDSFFAETRASAPPPVGVS